MNSPEESPRRRAPGSTLSARPFWSSSLAALHVPERRPWLPDGEADAGLDRGRPRAVRRRRTSSRGEGGVAGVGGGGRIGTLGVMPSASGAAALDAPPNSKTEVGDWLRAPKPTMEVVGDGSEASPVGDAAGPYSCKGQITHPCIEHQNGGGGGASAGTTFPSASSNGAAGPARSRLGTAGATC
ncbi:uncharacterized protein LOC124650085 [Lolium rigidum]|uniref:uncharacterized protein LOC124650085 n=1 Tax=Lolium rigidum TaxID=89674 RepID=UPI001F5C6A59|nr:uncharacterized protein LOC124650085 [Lolium rigidum]